MIRRILLIINKLSYLLNSINKIIKMLVQKFAIFIIISNA